MRELDVENTEKLHAQLSAIHATLMALVQAHAALGPEHQERIRQLIQAAQGARWAGMTDNTFGLYQEALRAIVNVIEIGQSG